MLLQEHGYFVLRFLCEDVAQHLDAVLDAILRTLCPPSAGEGAKKTIHPPPANGTFSAASSEGARSRGPTDPAAEVLEVPQLCPQR